MKVAVHNDDIDGISCAALILLKHPDAEIHFLSVTEAQETNEEYDIVADLPKPKNAKINIDHHESNLERLKSENRLSPQDLIDPTSPSAARLVAKYLGLESNIAKEIVEMADMADTGHLDEDLYKLDKVIKYYVRDEKMLRVLAEILSKKGRKFVEDKTFQELWKNVESKLTEGKKRIEKGLSQLKESKVKLALVLVSDDIPYFLAKDIAHLFLENGGYAIAVIYRDPNTGFKRVSFRISKECKIQANKIAEEIGGGGHEKAAGAILNNVEYALARILERFGEHGPVVTITI